MKLYPQVERFESVTIIIPVMNETTSLRQTVEIILRDVRREDIRELVIVVCKKTTAESMSVVGQLQKELGDLLVVLHQKRPFIGGALRDAFEIARGSHVLMMASDLETNPGDVVHLIREERKNPSGIVTASRWLGGGAFRGYSRTKLLCNWIFQRFFSLLYFTRLTDMTFAFRILPTRLVRSIKWDELRHPFGLETLVKPLRLGVPVSEIPSVWDARTEGESQNTFLRNFEYFRTGFRVRLASKRSLLLTEG